ncbi:MAG: SDR family NAD(P)-dependent oxidoreductase [Opitutales bacterium]
MNLRGKVCLITGANSGIGEAIAHAFAADGASVIVNGRRAAENERVAKDLRERYEAEVTVVTGDVADESFCLELIDKGFAVRGRLDVLVNNAGVGSSGRIADTTTEEFDRVQKINLYSCFWLSREAFKRMEQQEEVEPKLRGAILNIASIVGVEAWSGIGTYATSKHGMMALTRAMAEEGEEAGIRVAAICPAMVTTAMTGAEGPEYIQPEDIANTARYLLGLSAAAWPTEVVVRRRGAD